MYIKQKVVCWCWHPSVQTKTFLTKSRPGERRCHTPSCKRAPWGFQDMIPVGPSER